MSKRIKVDISDIGAEVQRAASEEAFLQSVLQERGRPFAETLADVFRQKKPKTHKARQRIYHEFCRPN